MKALILPVFVLLIACFSCKNKDLEEVISDKYPNGLPKKIEYFKKIGENKELVKEIRYFDNGEKFMEGEFKNGKRVGKWTSWFRNGNKNSEASFVDGNREKSGTVWNEDGSKLYEDCYKNGRPDSIWTFYKPSGSISKKVHFKEGKKLKEELF